MTPERKEAREWAESIQPEFGNVMTAESERWWRNIRSMVRELLAALDEAEKTIEEHTKHFQEHAYHEYEVGVHHLSICSGDHRAPIGRPGCVCLPQSVNKERARARDVVKAARPIVSLDEDGAYATAISTSEGFEGWETLYPNLEDAIKRYDEVA